MDDNITDSDDLGASSPISSCAHILSIHDAKLLSENQSVGWQCAPQSLGPRRKIPSAIGPISLGVCACNLPYQSVNATFVCSDNPL